MLSFWKDGKKIECEAIYDHGRVGQVVILDHVSFGTDPDLERYPLARYSQPCAFTIVEKVEGRDGHYVVVDDRGNRITLRDEHFGASVDYLYDANEWLAWQREHTSELLALRNQKIEQLGGHLALLKEILTNQGFRVLTQAQANSLGIPR